MDERQTSLEWILDGDPLFKILLGLFGVWVGFAIVVLTGRAKPNPCLVAPFFVLPLILLGLWPSHVGGALAVICHALGVLTSRWLFFAEAEHVVGLYYGKR